ncbi:hypothetical protein D9C73_028538 [Collichthys lucidus]|uniref:Uncharacterized protein n=1 Tax=Collichthys lucidus TaxID=240159 RepID=A0A4U5TWB4_COLLU|nr:hypothetical protein D9C73_028538 [Collichthys lucidus]
MTTPLELLWFEDITQYFTEGRKQGAEDSVILLRSLSVVALFVFIFAVLKTTVLCAAISTTRADSGLSMSLRTSELLLQSLMTLLQLRELFSEVTCTALIVRDKISLQTEMKHWV